MWGSVRRKKESEERKAQRGSRERFRRIRGTKGSEEIGEERKEGMVRTKEYQKQKNLFETIL